MKNEIIRELEKYGLEIDEPYKIDPTHLIIQIIQEDNIRLMYAIPLIIEQNKNNIDYKLINETLKGHYEDSWNKIKEISMKILDKAQKQLFNYEDKEYKEFYNHYLELKENMKKNEADKKRNIEKEMITHYDLTKLFTEKQIEIITKRANHEKLNRTEIEYYSRAIKQKIKSILNEDVIDICKRAF